MSKGEVKETNRHGEPICGRYKQYVGGHCQNPPGHKTDHEGEGACYACGGARNLEGNTQARKHGVHIHQSKYFQGLPESQKLYVIDIYRSYMDDAPFAYGNIGKSGEVWLCAINRHKRLSLNDYIDREGIIIEEDKIAPDGTPLQEKKEHPAVLAYHRLESSNLRKLQKLGILNEEGSRASGGDMSVEVTISGVDTDDGADTAHEADD